jgi:hypothetical protein
MWWFEASHRRATPKGQTFISCTAPCQKKLYLQTELLSTFVAHASSQGAHRGTTQRRKGAVEAVHEGATETTADESQSTVRRVRGPVGEAAGNIATTVKKRVTGTGTSIKKANDNTGTSVKKANNDTGAKHEIKGGKKDGTGKTTK